jgi:hypothetical protein
MAQDKFKGRLHQFQLIGRSSARSFGGAVSGTLFSIPIQSYGLVRLPD